MRGTGFVFDHFDERGLAWAIDRALSVWGSGEGPDRTLRVREDLVLVETPPAEGRYQIILNSDSAWYGGSNAGSGLPLDALPGPLHGQPCTLELSLPPLGALVLRRA